MGFGANDIGLGAAISHSDSRIKALEGRVTYLEGRIAYLEGLVQEARSLSGQHYTITMPGA